MVISGSNHIITYFRVGKIHNSKKVRTLKWSMQGKLLFFLSLPLIIYCAYVNEVDGLSSFQKNKNNNNKSYMHTYIFPFNEYTYTLYIYLVRMMWGGCIKRREITFFWYFLYTFKTLCHSFLLFLFLYFQKKERTSVWVMLCCTIFVYKIINYY